jgi:hypothetical protein
VVEVIIMSEILTEGEIELERLFPYQELGLRVKHDLG